MKITKVEQILLKDVPLSRPVRPAWAPGVEWHKASFYIIHLLTDEGIDGYGPLHHGIDSTTKEYFLGKDPFLIEQHIRWLRLAPVMAWGMEIALWDIIGKVCDQPLHRLWGGYTSAVKAYASLVQVGSVGERVDDAFAFYEEGFRAIKVRLHSETLSEDIAIVSALRSALGDKIDIIADANQAQSRVSPSAQKGIIWDVRRAINTAHALEEHGVLWLEEPLSRFDFRGLDRLRKRVTIDIAGGELNRYLHEFRTLIENDCYDIIQPDCLFSESIWQLRKVAALAEMYCKPCILHHAGGGLGAYANVHFACSVPNSPYLEIIHDKPGQFTPAQRLLQKPLFPGKDGTIVAPQDPGLGIHIDDDFLGRYGHIQ